MAVYDSTPHHTKPHHTTLLPEYRVAYIYLRQLGYGLKDMVQAMGIRDEELFSRFVRDDKNPDYIIATEMCLHVMQDYKIFRDYLRKRKDSILIFFSLECIEPDMNIFDYAFTWNPDLVCGDRIAHNIPYIYGRDISDFCTNDFTREEARRKLDSNPGFCNFIYSHSCEPRNTFFRLLSQYKRVDSLGSCMNNTGTKPTRTNSDWYKLSIEIKAGYKFSIAMENASYKGYTTEKIVSSLRAHTVPIYWGDPAVADFINPKAFINCSDYPSFDAVIERVKEIDNNDELWLDMVTQPWQTEEQHDKVVRMLDENDAFMRNIFTQDIKKARRRGTGTWPENCRKGFTGILGSFSPVRIKLISFIRKMTGKLIPKKLKPAVKKFLHMN